MINNFSNANGSYYTEGPIPLDMTLFFNLERAKVAVSALEKARLSKDTKQEIEILLLDLLKYNTNPQGKNQE